MNEKKETEKNIEKRKRIEKGNNIKELWMVIWKCPRSSQWWQKYHNRKWLWPLMFLIPQASFFPFIRPHLTIPPPIDSNFSLSLSYTYTHTDILSHTHTPTNLSLSTSSPLLALPPSFRWLASQRIVIISTITTATTNNIECHLREQCVMFIELYYIRFGCGISISFDSISYWSHSTVHRCFHIILRIGIGQWRQWWRGQRGRWWWWRGHWQIHIRSDTHAHTMTIMRASLSHNMLGYHTNENNNP